MLIRRGEVPPAEKIRQLIVDVRFVDTPYREVVKSLCEPQLSQSCLRERRQGAANYTMCAAKDGPRDSMLAQSTTTSGQRWIMRGISYGACTLYIWQ